ncbi:Putative GAF sensor protein (modular protein) [uncultured Mycobacterium sp.]|uniref:Putative GAF sensor protein (Modular protein) n=1 Tax=uncultured Mycobacterium sp. TaxID=171292 RepID=A0A1Y5PKZ6_9MYCO|nr:Putative GAF sensor protein (modular protein) [uncultured Mycobacterium sp.]
MTSAAVVSSLRSRRRRGLSLQAHDRDEVADILASARARYPGIHPSAAITDCAEALDVLDAVWQAAVDTLTATAVPEKCDIALLSRVKSMISRIQAGEVDRVDSALASLRDGITELEQIDDPGHLLDRAAIAATNLGFDRAMISSVHDGQWLPVAGHIERDPAWASQIVAAGQEEPEIIDAALPEAEMLRRLRPILVDDAQRLARRYATIIDISKGQRYLAAPIMSCRNVIGFVHADTFYRPRRFTNTDIRLLGLFGEFLGTTMTRLMMLDELRALHAQAEGLTSRIAELERSWSGRTYRRPALSRAADPAAPHCPGRAPAANVLTRRELEVLELVADGATNARIARVLTISEGTVKGHMKHIFRKLGTANRAEAVSYWLRLTT